VSISFAPPAPESRATGFKKSRSSFWPRITQDGSLRAWRGAHKGGAEFATPFDSCSQRLAELIVLLQETSHSIHAAFLRNGFVPFPPLLKHTGGKGVQILGLQVATSELTDQRSDLRCPSHHRSAGALARVIEACGGSVMTGAAVKEVLLRNGRAAAVRLADGRAVEGSRFIASAIDAPTTMRMVGEDLFLEDARKKLNGWRWGNHSLVTLHLALREKPGYRSAEFDPDIDRAFNIFFGMDDIEQVRSCFEHCAGGKFPHVLMGNGACNSAVDPTYAPTNGHSAFWWPFAPYAVDGEADNWDRQKDDYTERVLTMWREYASNLDDCNVRAKLLFTPLDIERLNVNMVRGAVRMGAYIPSQLGINRPHPLLSGTRTPIEGLYLCGSSTGNGGGINGAPGYIAANAIADDLGLKRPWARVPDPEWRQ
jgi:hypothetical protein